MSRITSPDAFVAGARPLDRKAFRARYRPSIDVERVRESWTRAHQHFCAMAEGDLLAASVSYAPKAVIYNALLGELKGQEIERAARGFARRTANHRLEFQIESAAADAAKTAWTETYDFVPTGRRVTIKGTTRLHFGPQGIEQQVDTIDRRAWSRQAFGLKGAVLAFLPGWRHFLAAELRLAFAVDGDDR